MITGDTILITGDTILVTGDGGLVPVFEASLNQASNTISGEIRAQQLPGATSRPTFWVLNR
jgi:hypothetical protein